MPSRRALFAALIALTLATPARAWEELALTEAEMAQSGALVVDIRTPEEWAETGVLPGIARLTYTDPESFAAAFLAEYGAEVAKGRDVILLCRSGRRSAAAAEALSSQVGNRVVSVAGGMITLLEKGATTVTP